MEISEENLELIEKIRAYRSDKEKLEIIDFKNQELEKKNQKLVDALKDLQKDMINRDKLIKQIEELKSSNNKLKRNLESFKDKFDFVVTTPDSTKTVYGEIRKHLNMAEKEVLVCSPWITYLVDEFSGFKKEVDLKIITTFQEQDIKTGITDIDKLRALMDLGAQIRYNNNLHAKMILIDSKFAIISSANLTKRGLSVNYEAGVLIKDIGKVKKALEFFCGVWMESEPLSDDELNKYKFG